MFGFKRRRKRIPVSGGAAASPSVPEDTGQDDDIRGGPQDAADEAGWDGGPMETEDPGVPDASAESGTLQEDAVGETVPLPGSAAAPAGAGRGSAPASGPPDDGTEDGGQAPSMDGEASGPGSGGDIPETSWDGGSGPDGDGSGDPDDPDGINGAVDAMAGEGSGPGRKRRKRAKPAKPAKADKADKADNGPKARKRHWDAAGGGNAWSAMDETRRQVVFTCGCVTAGFCAILLVIFGTAFVCRMFSAQPRPAIAMPDQQENVYYDAGGRMHVNVYMSQQPDTEITVYVLPDGTVTTEKPAEGEPGVRTAILYVDKDGNLSETPPDRQEQAGSVGGDEDGSPVRSSQVLYLDGDGNLAAEKPSEGSWRPVTVILGRDGSVSVVPGEVHGAEAPGKDVPVTGAAEPAGDPGQAAQAADIPPLVLYIGTDGSVSTEKPGDGEFRKYTVDVNGGTPSVIPEVPAASASEITDVPGTWDDSEDQAGQAEGTYTVRHGDTLTAISRRLGFTVDFLAEYNGIRNKNLIITGDAIRYPL